MNAPNAPPHPGREPRDHLQFAIAALAATGIAVHVVLRLALGPGHLNGSFRTADLPLFIVLALGGIPLVIGLLGNLLRAEFGSDLLAGISIVTSVVLGEYLAGSLVVLMLSGGEAVESFAVNRARSALSALAKRLPAIAHKIMEGRMVDVPGDLNEVRGIRVSLLVRDLRADREYRNQTIYRLGNREYGPYEDNFRRLLVSETIEVKNHALR